MLRFLRDIDFRLRRDADRYGPRRILVLDLGAASTKVVLAVRNQRTLRWAKAALWPAIGTDLDTPAWDLAAQMRDAAIKAEYVSLVVSGRNTMVRMLTFPGKPGTEEARDQQVLQALGMGDDYAVAHQLVSGDGEGERPEFAVLTASMLTGTIGQLNALTEQAGLKPVSLVTSGVAAANLIKAVPDILPDGTATGFLEIGKETSILLLFHGSQLAFARQFKVGVGSLVDSLKASTELDSDTAEKLFHSGSFDFSANVAGTVDPWLHQIGISLDFFERRYGQTVSGVHVFGGGAESRVLEGIIRSHLRCPVNPWSPIEQLGELEAPEDLEGNVGLYSLALSEALRIMRTE